ncbi:MAG TPA: hypothetical protein VN922_03880 [Bacteroidia bacterium]|nr:hypothetical protein [Bacteroidia bacterium]
MKYKNILITLFICAYNCLNAQVQVLDPDNMQPVQATSTGHEQTIQDILPMGNWKPNKQLDSLKVGDTLVLVNDNTIRETDLNFSKAGKVTRYTQHMSNTSTSLSFNNTWDEIGYWQADEAKIIFHIDIDPPSNIDKSRKISFKEISKSYQVIKLYVTSIGVEVSQ